MLSGTEPPFPEVQMSLFLTQNVMAGCSGMLPVKINDSSRISLSVVGINSWRGKLKLSLHSTLCKIEDRSLVHNKDTVEEAADAGHGAGVVL